MFLVPLSERLFATKLRMGFGPSVKPPDPEELDMACTAVRDLLGSSRF